MYIYVISCNGMYYYDFNRLNLSRDKAIVNLNNLCNQSLSVILNSYLIYEFNSD